MNETKEILTSEKLKEIYTDEKFRNQVAFAHGHHNSKGDFIQKITCSYPVTYIVTEKQIKEAEQERQRAKKQTIAENKNKLMFVGMGGTYKARYKGDVCNHRIRTEFENPQGRKFFVEFGTNADYNTIRVDFSIDRTKQKELNDSHDKQSEFYNYKGLEKNNHLGDYTLQNIIKIVNEYFGCNFKEVVIDNYNTRTEEFTCISPDNYTKVNEALKAEAENEALSKQDKEYKAEKIAERLSKGDSVDNKELYSIEALVIEKLNVIRNNCNYTMKQIKNTISI